MTGKRRAALLTGFVTLACLAVPGTTTAVVGRGSEFSLAPGMHASTLTLGPDGNMWFGGSRQGRKGTVDVVGRVTPGGHVSEFALPPRSPAELGISSIVAGSDGHLYFTQPNANAIGRVSTSGQIESLGPLPNAGSRPRTIVAAPDGTLWVTEEGIDRVGHIYIGTGFLQEIGLAPGARPTGIAAGPDGTIWVAEPGLHRVGRKVPSEPFVSLQVFDRSIPSAVVRGPEGDVWVTDEGGPWLERFAPSSFTPKAEYKRLELPFGRGTRWLVFGPRGDFWFSSGNRVGSISPDKFLGEPACLPAGCAFPVEALAVGPKRELWYASGIPRSGPSGGRLAAGTVGVFRAPRISVAIHRHTGRLASRYVEIGVSCSGGAAGQFCRGRMRVMGSGGAPSVLGSRGIELRVRANRRLRVRLSRVAAGLLAREGRLPARVEVKLAGGNHAARRVILRAGGEPRGVHVVERCAIRACASFQRP